MTKNEIQKQIDVLVERNEKMMVEHAIVEAAFERKHSRDWKQINALEKKLNAVRADERKARMTKAGVRVISASTLKDGMKIKLGGQMVKIKTVVRTGGGRGRTILLTNGKMKNLQGTTKVTVAT